MAGAWPRRRPDVDGRGADQRHLSLSLSPDSLIPREDWKRRVDDARKRAEQARRDWRLNDPRRMVEPDPPEKIATQRVLSDDTLQPGDIVSTDKGFLLFAVGPAPMDRMRISCR
jgi:hypothetical protein